MKNNEIRSAQEQAQQSTPTISALLDAALACANQLEAQVDTIGQVLAARQEPVGKHSGE